MNRSGPGSVKAKPEEQDVGGQDFSVIHWATSEKVIS